MKVFVWLLVLGMLVTLGLSARPAAAAEYPNVANLTPFTAEAKFMSLPGYLRWLVFMDTKTWISRTEATEAVRQQMGGM